MGIEARFYEIKEKVGGEEIGALGSRPLNYEVYSERKQRMGQ